MLAQTAPFGFLILFAGMWFLMTTAFGALSGWYELAKRFPDRRDQEPFIKLGFQSGRMGKLLGGVGFGGCLTLAGCTIGLRISVWRIFGPFSRPIFIPWEDIKADRSIFAGFMMTNLKIGRSEVGSLSIFNDSWDVIRIARKQNSGEDMTGPMRQALLKMLLRQGGVPVLLAGLFFTIVSRVANNGQPELPLAVCFAFPTVVFGTPALVRYLLLRAKFA